MPDMGNDMPGTPPASGRDLFNAFRIPKLPLPSVRIRHMIEETNLPLFVAALAEIDAENETPFAREVMAAARAFYDAGLERSKIPSDEILSVPQTNFEALVDPHVALIANALSSRTDADEIKGNYTVSAQLQTFAKAMQDHLRIIANKAEKAAGQTEIGG